VAGVRFFCRKQSTVSYWAQKDEIPGRWWPQLLALARENGVLLSMDDFVIRHDSPPPEPEPSTSATEFEERIVLSPSDSPLDPVEVGGGSHFLFYQSDKGNVSVQVLLEHETVWVSQRGMAEIFDVTVQNVSSHLQNIIFRDNELDQSVIKKSLITAPDGKTYETALYNLDAIISVGYRVNS
jgi:hypothetical protein